MRDFYPSNRLKSVTNLCLILFLALTFAPQVALGQVEYTVLQGQYQTSIQGPNPFATEVRNQRSQFLYLSNNLLMQDAPSGFITSLSIKITQLALPAAIQPQNLQIKMGQTGDIVLPSTLIPNLPIYYSSATENITSTGWYTFTLQTPFQWDGYSNIIVEFCRTNEISGDSFEVEVNLGGEDAYQTAALLSDNLNGNGCTLTGSTQVTLPNRRLIPSLKVTMTNPCAGAPNPGTMVVSDGVNYCSDSFTLSALDDSQESGLSYQWQSNFHNDDAFTDIEGATNATLTTTQEFATYYRRGVICGDAGTFVYPPSILVQGADCKCNPTVTTIDNSGITNVTFGSINNSSSSAPYYSDFSEKQTIVNRLLTLPLSSKITVATDAMTTKAWIDWNQNGTYEASEEYDLGNVSSGLDVSSGNIVSVTVPGDAILGATTMRVRSATIVNDELLTPCDNFLNGETEDYTIIVEPQLGISNPDMLNNSVVVITNGNQLDVRSTVATIQSVKVFDLRGRLLYVKSGLNDMQVAIQLYSATTQLLIVEIKTNSGLTVNKKVAINN